jgi:solute carrier family 5 (sodium/glucose cotransporter), member 9
VASICIIYSIITFLTVHIVLSGFLTVQGAFWGLLTGHAIGLTRMILDFIYPSPACGQQDNRPAFLTDLHYTYFSQLNLVVISLVIVVVSMMTTPPDNEQVTQTKHTHFTVKSTVLRQTVQ